MSPVPYFSVVIDNYNYGRYLAQAIDSVLVQDFPARETEIIVVDDGSTDDSRQVLERYKGKVNVLLQENRGQAGAFASGFAALRGQVVCLLDSDDYWEPGKLSAVARKLEDRSADIVQHYQRDVDAEGRPLKNIMCVWPETYDLKDFIAGRIEHAATSSLAFRRPLLEAVLPVPGDIFYMYDNYLIDCGLFHGNIANISKILGYHRIHGANNWARGHISSKKLEGNIRELKSFRRYLEPKLKERGLAFSAQYVDFQNMELKKREILLAAHQGERGRALRIWKELAVAHGAMPYGAFRCATCFLAVISPALYVRLYDFYCNWGAWGRFRQRILPIKFDS